jgi:uncharacterized protein YgbK (DUF1537 family)
MMKVGVIADDLTGANGTGVKLSKQGLTSVTSFSRIPKDIPDSNIVVSLDTDSRYIKPESAKDRVQYSVQQFQRWKADIICKRIDSTFRGNIGAEIDALLESIDDSVGIVVPSYPLSGRTVIGGYLLVNGTLLHETDVAKDPVHPIDDSYLPNILSEQTDQCIGLLELKDIKMGVSEIKKKLQEMIDYGKRVVICDATTNEHIEAIAEAMVILKEKRCIPIDSGPLTNYFVGKKSQNELETDSKILISVGSVTTVTDQQLKYLINQMKLTPVHVQAEKLISFGSERENEIRRVVEKVENVINKQSMIVITTNRSDQPMVNFKQISNQKGVAEDRLAKRITAGLAEISKMLIQKNNAINGCFFSGGDVTASFCETVKAQGIKLMDEVMPLAAYGEIMGGDFDGLSIVTKGGLVGGRTAIYDCVEYLSQIMKQTRRISNEK